MSLFNDYFPNTFTDGCKKFTHIYLRPAKTKDWKRIKEIYHSSVIKTCISCKLTERQTQAWIESITDKYIQNALANPDLCIYVCEVISNEKSNETRQINREVIANIRPENAPYYSHGVQGFFFLDIGTGILHALYLSPTWFGKGIGTALLLKAHDIFIKESCFTTLRLYSTDNAKEFYITHGYDILAHSYEFEIPNTKETNSPLTIQSTLMVKNFDTFNNDKPHYFTFQPKPRDFS